MKNHVKQINKLISVEHKIMVAISVLIIILNSWIMFVKDTIPSTPTKKVNKTEQDTNNNFISNFVSIAIPGYGEITLKANKTEQDISFKNPRQNQCYFVIYLFLSDGTLLWKSDYISPGESSNSLILLQELDEGVYEDAALEYLCFSLDEKLLPLNQARTKLTLRFK